ncbi:MAG: hypothetical protein RBR06_05975 [Desulfuromonadaceae bacterium]|nr:hypothetical protein [Desulfuromonadaceae bacterium]
MADGGIEVKDVMSAEGAQGDRFMLDLIIEAEFVVGGGAQSILGGVGAGDWGGIGRMGSVPTIMGRSGSPLRQLKRTSAPSFPIIRKTLRHRKKLGTDLVLQHYY